MRREALLLETLIQKRTTRSGPVYLFRRPAGPPAVPGDDRIDKWLHNATQSYDFTPLFNGDQIQAREVADGYIRHLKQKAQEDGIDWTKVSARLKQINPHLRRGFQTFAVFFDARIKTSR